MLRGVGIIFSHEFGIKLGYARFPGHPAMSRKVNHLSLLHSVDSGVRLAANWTRLALNETNLGLFFGPAKTNCQLIIKRPRCVTFEAYLV